MAFRNNVYARTRRYLSIDKCFKTLKDNTARVRDILTRPEQSIEGLIQWIGEIFATKHWLEKRKNKMCYEEIVNINY